MRETLDYHDPFGSAPDRGTTGRILLDSWSGPDDEDEIHGGFVFRDGSRWLLHYMKWSGDGHICCALAASRDGLNFARVAGGRQSLPVGDGVWRQYYTGCGCKHGLGGIGARTSHFGLNAPNQEGLAEMPTGRWAHLQLRRDAEEGECVTAPLVLASPHRLTLDVEGLGGANLASCAVWDVRTGSPLPSFGYVVRTRTGSGGSRPHPPGRPPGGPTGETIRLKPGLNR
jgi:hypothetical protein